MKKFVNVLWFLGSAAQHVAKSLMGLAPDWDALVKANKTDKFLSQLDNFSKTGNTQSSQPIQSNTNNSNTPTNENKN